MIAITTRVYGPTDRRSARLVARTVNGQQSTTKEADIPPTWSLYEERSHQLAAETLKLRAGWDGELVSGAIIGGGYAHCFVPKGFRLAPVEGA